MKCLRSKYIQCAIEPANEIMSASGQVANDVLTEVQNIFNDLSLLDEYYQAYMQHCLGMLHWAIS